VLAHTKRNHPPATHQEILVDGYRYTLIAEYDARAATWTAQAVACQLLPGAREILHAVPSNPPITSPVSPITEGWHAGDTTALKALNALEGQVWCALAAAVRKTRRPRSVTERR